MNHTTKTRRPLAVLAAVCAILALTVTAFASSGLAERVFHLFSVGTVSVGMDEDGSVHVDRDLEDNAPVSPLEIRDDGRIYFIANGEGIDITDRFSYEEPYVYTHTETENQRHIFIVGGEPDAAGWAECVVEDANGDTALGLFVLELAPEAEDQPTPWLDAGLAQVLGTDVTVDIQ